MARDFEDRQLNLEASSGRGVTGSAAVAADEDTDGEEGLDRPQAATRGVADGDEDDDDALGEEDLNDEDDEEEDDLEGDDEDEDLDEEDEDEEDLDEEDLDDEEEEDEEDEEVARQSDALAASTDEEVDALRVNLEQDGDRGFKRDSTGEITDDVARAQLAGFTEVGEELDDRGARSVVPGRDDTSATLRRHHPNTALARSEDIVEGNLDEPRDEIRSDSKVDEGTAA